MIEQEDICQTCGGTVAEERRPGRYFEYRAGVKVKVPADWPMHTCIECGQRYLSSEELEALEQVLEAHLRERLALGNDEAARVRRKVRDALRIFNTRVSGFFQVDQMNRAIAMLDEVASGLIGETDTEQELKIRVRELEESRDHYRARCSELRAELGARR